MSFLPKDLFLPCVYQLCQSVLYPNDCSSFNVIQFVAPIFSTDKKWTIEVVKGPNDDWIDEKGHQIFLNSNWKLQSKSDRTGYRLDGPKWSFTEKATKKALENGSYPSNIIDQAYPVGGAINLAGQTPIILVNDGPSMGGFIIPYTVPSAIIWKLGQAKPGDIFNFAQISLDEAQNLRKEQKDLCGETSLESYNNNLSLQKPKFNKIDIIKVKDFEKEKNSEKIRDREMEKKGMKKMKVQFFDG